MDKNIVLGNRLKKARSYLNLSQEYVADVIGIPRSSVSSMESGKRNVSTDELKMLSELYGWSVEELLYGKQTKKTKMFARAFSELSEHDQNEIMNLIEFKKMIKEESVRYV